MLTPEDREEIHRLLQAGMGRRTIARKLGLNVKTVRRLWGGTSPPSLPAASSSNETPPEADPSPGASTHPTASKHPPSKLAPFEEAIRKKAEQGLLVPRILREIREMGYRGSRTILGEFVRRIRGPKPLPPPAARRFETRPAREAQADWSPFRLLIGGVSTLVHCFAMVLGFSRMLFVAFYRNERLPTLLHAHVEAFSFFGGICEIVVYDNMAAVTSGRIGNKPLWNPAFLEFTRYYGFTPFACRPRHPDRKGKIERPFSYIESDFLMGHAFTSLDDLNAQARDWLVRIANRRVHGTTLKIPEDLFAAERDLLIALPKAPFPTYETLVRTVQNDGCIPVSGSFFPVPQTRPGEIVHARQYPGRLDVLRGGEVAAAYKIPDRPTRIYPEGPPPARLHPTLARSAMEADFLHRFSSPAATKFLDGLKLRMKSLAPVHLNQIARLAGAYPPLSLAAALEKAAAFRNFNALAVERILQRLHPAVVPEVPAALLTGDPAQMGALDDADSGSPAEYAFDAAPAMTTPAPSAVPPSSDPKTPDPCSPAPAPAAVPGGGPTADARPRAVREGPHSSTGAACDAS